MYAVVETGGKQYKVEQGSSLFVDRLDAKQGDKVALRAVMFRDTEVLVEVTEVKMLKAKPAAKKPAAEKKAKAPAKKPAAKKAAKEEG
jgi:large subunit ribosomal protein L21